MEKLKTYNVSRPAEGNHENYMDCVVKDINYGGVDVLVDRAYGKGEEMSNLKRESRKMPVKNLEEKIEVKSMYREKPMKMGKMSKADMRGY